MSGPASTRQNSLGRMIQESEIAWNRRDHSTAIEILERAVKLAPSETILLFYLGRCHGSRYDYAAAERYFEKAVRAEGWTPASFLKAGRYCLSFSRHEMAAQFFERAVKNDPRQAEALVELARIYLRQNRVLEATDLVDRALQARPAFSAGLLARATILRTTGQLAEAVTVLESFVTKPEPNGWVQAEAWYELGATLDRQSRYDEAADAFFKAKATPLPTPHKGQTVQAAELESERIVKGLSADLLQRWRDENQTGYPPVALLAGHPRSGTTLLEQILDTHPQIVSIEETLIFSEEAFAPAALDLHRPSDLFLSVLDRADPSRLKQSRDDYFRCTERYLGQALDGRLLVDKNPSLTAFMPAFSRLLPQAKFLVALRDPRDVCLSCFMQPLFPTGPNSVTYPDFEATIRQYAAVMRIWRALKPILPQPWLEVRYEDLLDDLDGVSRRALAFLEVPWNDNVLRFQQHTQNKLVRSPTYADVRKPVSKSAIGRWRHYQKYLEPHLAMLEPFVKAFGYQ